MNVKNHIKRYIYESIAINKATFVFVLLIVFLLKASMMLIPITIGLIIDALNLEATKSLHDILPLLFNFVGILLFLLILSPLRGYFLTSFVQNSILKKSIEWIRIIFNRDLSAFNHLQVGKLVNAIDRGIISHEKILHHFIDSLLPVSIELIISTSFLLYYGGIRPFVFIFILLGLHYLLISYLIVKRSKQINLSNNAEDDLAGELVESLSNGKILNLEKSVEYGVSRLKGFLERYAKTSINLSVSGSAIDSIHLGTSNLVVIIVIIQGAYNIMNSQMTIGQLVALISIVSRVTDSFNNLLQSKRFLNQSFIDVEDLIVALDKPSFNREGSSLVDIQKLEVKPFRFLDNDRLIFEVEKDLVFSRGEKIAIIGPTGKGKTTLLEIISGLTQEARKTILIDGKSLEQLSSRSHFDIIRYCPQTNYILSGKLAESIFFKDKMSQREVNILKDLSLDQSFHLSDKILAEKGSNISGGEAKRLSLSRIFARTGDIHLFDEPTTALDSKVSDLVWDLVFSSSKKSILVVTTHDYSRLHDFDRVLIVNNAKIVSDLDPKSTMESKIFLEMIKEKS